MEHVMAAIAWIASYPKSGNTWLRFMLASYISRGPVGSVRDVHNLIPSAGPLDQAPLDHPGVLPVKTHEMPGARSLLPYRSAAFKAVYIVRNPRDIILSGIRHFGLDYATEEARKLAAGFIEYRGLYPGRRKPEVGSWPENVLSWTTLAKVRQHFPDIAVLTVRYEDLRADTVGMLYRIIDFIGIESVIPDYVRMSVEASSLENMRALEAKEKTAMPGSRRSPFGGKGVFVGQGLHNQSLRCIGNDIEDLYKQLIQDDKEFSQCVRDFGYDS
jgi:hypothetical protein